MKQQIKTDDGLRIELEWIPVEGVASPELAATWSRIEIWVGHQCVTLVEDLDTQSLRRSVYASAYPLAEWIAYNWWFIHADGRKPVREDSEFSVGSAAPFARWRSNHDLRSSGDGFLWPRMTIEPDGKHFSVSWFADEHAQGRIAFRADGHDTIAGAQASSELSRFVDAVVDKLDEADVADTDLQNEWKAIRELDSEERDFCVASARLGLDPFDAASGAEEAILNASAELPGEMLDDFLDAVTIEDMDDGLKWVKSGVDLIHGATGSDDLLAKLPQLIEGKNVGQLPWEVGYRQARSMRSLFDTDPAKPIIDLHVPVLRHERVRESALLAIGGTSNSGGVVVAFDGDEPTAPSARFVQARALWFAAHPRLRDQFLITSLAGNQRVARAFAAELLAPAAGIKQLVRNPRSLLDETTVERVAKHFRVGDAVIRHQVQNQLLRTHAY